MAVNDSKAGRHDSVEHCPGIQAGAGKAVRLALFLMACAGAGAVQAEIAQHSLIVATPPVVEPNVMFTLDDSGSMLFNYLPDTDLPYQIYAIHPREPNKIAYFGIAGLLDSRDGNILSARRRSSDVNLLYYNPKVRYQPWMNADGTREPEADPGAVHYFYKHNGDMRLDLRGQQPVAGSANPICAASVRQGGKCVPFVRGQAPAYVKPATYYVLTGVNRNDPASYRRVSIADHQEFDIETSDRTECRQKSPGVRTCTQEQEYKNFANWFQYHRFRYLLAVGAVGEAFARQLGGDVRVGYGRINKGEGSVDGVVTRVVERGVRRFDGQDKTAFFSWLQSVNPSGSTPLLGASIAVGEYFKRDGAQGPWSDTDSKGQTRQLSCRRSYHILMTDGQYNDLDNTQIDRIPGMSNADNELGPVIPASGKNRAFRYDPNDPNNRLYRSATGRTLADVAMYYWNRDLMPNLANNVPVDADNPSFWQNVTMYTLSFGADGTLPASTPESQASTLQDIVSGRRSWPAVVRKESDEAVDDLWHAAVNGRGRYLNVKNSTEFLASMRQILAEIVNRSGSTAGVSVSNRALQTSNQKFVPSFMTRDRTGNLQAFALGVDGREGNLQWSAAEKMPHWSRRHAIVGNGSTTGVRASNFFWSAERNDELPQTLKQALLDVGGAPGQGAQREVWGRQLVAYLLGDGNYETTLFRPRRNVLGQIVNSAPVFIGAATNQGYASLPERVGSGGQTVDSGARSYRAYLKEQKGAASRQKLVMVGSNEGFVHAFRASDGVESFAYAPNVVMKEMARLANRSNQEQRFLMDGPLVEADAHLDGKWQNVVVGTTGAGPKVVFALNMTRTADADLGTKTLMWELDESHAAELGHVLAAPEVGMLRDGTWVAIFGNGYESKSRRAQLFVVDLATGKVLKTLDTGRGSMAEPNGLGGIKLLRDGNQVITAAYAGDLHGNVWKFDLASERAAEWKVSLGGRPLFTTADRRPVTAAPALVPHPRGGTMVLIGTGKLFESGDEKSRALESYYGLWDNGTLVQKQAQAGGTVQAAGWQWREGEPIALTTLVRRNQTLTQNGKLAYETDPTKVLNWATHRGWHIPLNMMSNRGLRTIAPPQMVSGMALFEAMTPVVEVDYVSNPCAELVNVPGFSTFVEPITGGMATKQIIDTNNDGKIDSRDMVVSSWGVDNWTGRSAVLNEEPAKPCADANCTQAPRPGLCPEGTLTSVALTADSRQVLCVSIPGPNRWWWRELAVPDVTYNAGATPTAVPTGTVPSAAKGGSPRP